MHIDKFIEIFNLKGVIQDTKVSIPKFSSLKDGESIQGYLDKDMAVSIDLVSSLNISFWAEMSKSSVDRSFHNLQYLGSNGMKRDYEIDKMECIIKLDYCLPSSINLSVDCSSVSEIIYHICQHYLQEKDNLNLHHFPDLWIEQIIIHPNGVVDVNLCS